MPVRIARVTTNGYIEPVDPSLQPTGAEGAGSAIDLGDGLFLTAAHLFSAVETLPAPYPTGIGYYESYDQ